MNNKNFNNGIKTDPMSYLEIEQISQFIRNEMKIYDCFPAKKIEFLLKIFNYDLVISNQLNEEGFTRFDEKIVMLREDVYDNLLLDNCRSRFTAMHEFGHVILHNRNNLSCCRTDEIKLYCNPEWQANAFAGSILVPANEIKESNLTIKEIMNKYKVSEECVKKRLFIINNKL